MLRAAARQQILEILEGSYFGPENFTTEFGTGENNRLFVVRFLGDSRFFFSASKSSLYFSTTEAPGNSFLTREDFVVRSLSETLVRLSQWTRRIHEELISSNPFAREVSDLKAQLDRRLADLGEELTGFFTKEEADELEARLDAFASRLQELSTQNEALRTASESLSATVTDLQAAIAVLNRQTWLRMAGGRLLSGLKAVATSKEAREFALEAAKKLLLPSPK